MTDNSRAVLQQRRLQRSPLGFPVCTAVVNPRGLQGQTRIIPHMFTFHHTTKLHVLAVPAAFLQSELFLGRLRSLGVKFKQSGNDDVGEQCNIHNAPPLQFHI